MTRRPRWRDAKRVLAGVVSTAVVAAACAQDTSPRLRPYAPGTPLGMQGTMQRPGLATLRQDEDWSWLADPRRRSDAFDAWKFVPLDASGRIHLSFGVESFLRYEFNRNESFGDAPGSDGTLNTRFNPSVALSFGDRLRLYAALKHGWVAGSRFPVSPADRDRLDLHQAFVELGFGDAVGLPASDLFVRAGRQELHYGAGRLISIREGPNVRRDFEGALLRGRIGSTVGDVFAFRPTTERIGFFDNGTDEKQQLHGAYTSSALPGTSSLDLYYIRQHRERSPYAFLSSPLDETRHTLGTRYVFGTPARGWSGDLEAGIQLGTARRTAAASLDIRAGYVTGAIAHAWAERRWRPALRVEYGVTSGDGDPGDGRLGTFRAPFPPGRYFGEANPIGPGNLSGFRPSLAFELSQQLTVRPQVTLFWRASLDDGVYTRGQTVFRGNGGRARFVGTEPSFVATWTHDRHLVLEGIAAYFVAGSYLDDNPPARNVTYIELTARYRF